MKIIYHPGTGTILDAAECLVMDTAVLDQEAAAFGDETDITDVLANVDVVGIDLGALLEAVAVMQTAARGVTTSQFVKKGEA